MTRASLGAPGLTELAVTATWRTTTVARHGRTDPIAVTERDCLRYGAFGDAAGRAALAREPGIITRYADRWSIEPANATGKPPAVAATRQA